MGKTVQSLVVSLLIIIVLFQVALVVKIDSIKPKPKQEGREEPRIPTLDEIDQRIMHWGQHFGATFSGRSRISSLESRMNSRFDAMEKKLNAKREGREGTV